MSYPAQAEGLGKYGYAVNCFQKSRKDATGEQGGTGDLQYIDQYFLKERHSEAKNVAMT